MQPSAEASRTSHFVPTTNKATCTTNTFPTQDHTVAAALPSLQGRAFKAPKVSKQAYRTSCGAIANTHPTHDARAALATFHKCLDLCHTQVLWVRQLC